MAIGDGVPETVTEKLVQKIWQEYHNDENLKIANCDINLVGGKGDNYSSIMCRAKCKITRDGQPAEEKTMVIKTFPVGEYIEQYVRESQSFEKETRMLQEVLPELEKILLKAGIDAKIGAKVYYSQTEPHILAMEDLSIDTFAIADRFVGLCIEECLELVKTLALFHAASMVYLKNNPDHEFFDKWIWGSEKAKNLTIGINSSMETIIKDIDNWSSVKWSEKLQKRLDNNYPQILFDAVDRKNPKRPMVINHGDLWLNNIMFNQSSAQGPRVRFVDLQLSWKNSPVFDLIYFLFTSPRTYVRINQMETILQTYHEKFSETTKKLGLEVEYSYQDFKDDFKDNLILGFAMFHFVFPILTAPRQHALDSSNEKVSEDGQPPDMMRDNPIFTNKFFQQSFVATLPFFEENGIL